MTLRFKAVAREEIEPNRLLTVDSSEDGELPSIGYPKAGSVPDYRSTGTLKEGSTVTVVRKDDAVWNVEAGEDIPAGSGVEAGDEGLLKKSSDAGFGYLTESVKEGEVATVIRRVGASSGGSRGPRGYKGQDGFGTEKEYKDIIKRLEALEKKEGE